MSRKLWKVLLASPAFLGMGLTGSAIASEAHTAVPSVASLETAQNNIDLAQVNSVNDLSDVSPADWAYTALQNLVEQYQCIEGYPNRTFRGGQPLTRYEFAAGLNACLDNLLAIVDTINPDELATIRRLQEEFSAELATLRGRVDALEAEVAELREQQFSTTTKLRGQVDSNFVVPFGDLDTDEQAAFTARARLNFDASFTGEDRLRIRLQAGDDDNGILSAAGGLANSAGGDFDVEINDFFYTFPVGERIDVIIGANSIQTDDFVTSTIVPFDGPSVADPGGPALYDFDMGGGGFAGGASFALTDNIVIDAGYSADGGDSGSNDPDDGGIFGADSQSYIVQASFISDGLIDGALVYMRGNDGDDNDFTDTFGGLLNLDFGRFFVAGYAAFHDNDDDDDFSWQAGAGINDLFIEGSQLGAYYANLPDFDDDPFMAEVYYDVPLNQFLNITPAIIYGDLDEGGDDESFYAAIRATFRF